MKSEIKVNDSVSIYVEIDEYFHFFQFFLSSFLLIKKIILHLIEIHSVSKKYNKEENKFLFTWSILASKSMQRIFIKVKTTKFRLSWSWIDTELIMTEERHPDQIFYRYTLTMNHIHVRHCFECTKKIISSSRIIFNGLMILSTFY